MIPFEVKISGLIILFVLFLSVVLLTNVLKITNGLSMGCMLFVLSICMFLSFSHLLKTTSIISSVMDLAFSSSISLILLLFGILLLTSIIPTFEQNTDVALGVCFTSTALLSILYSCFSNNIISTSHYLILFAALALTFGSLLSLGVLSVANSDSLINVLFFVFFILTSFSLFYNVNTESGFLLLLLSILFLFFSTFMVLHNTQLSNLGISERTGLIVITIIILVAIFLYGYSSFISLYNYLISGSIQLPQPSLSTPSFSIFDFYDLYHKIIDFISSSILFLCYTCFIFFPSLFALELYGITNVFLQMILFVIGIIMYFTFVFYLFDIREYKNIFYSITGIILFFLLFLYSFGTLSNLNNIITFIIFFLGLTILYAITRSYLKSKQGWWAYIYSILFYLPTLFYDMILYLLREYNLTTNIVFVLFVTEVVLLLAYNYIPVLINQFINRNAIIILPGTQFLDIPDQIHGPIVDNSGNTIVDSSGSIVKVLPTVLTNYCISMWIYLNPQPINLSVDTVEYLIFHYGNSVNDTGNPKITFSNHGTEHFNIYFSNHDAEKPYELSLPKQTWHQFVFNYTSTRVDLFVNGKLNYTRTFNEGYSMPSYSNTNTISIGQENGVYGAISNSKCYTVPLTQTVISNSYTLLMYKNPPVDL